MTLHSDIEKQVRAKIAGNPEHPAHKIAKSAHEHVVAHHPDTKITPHTLLDHMCGSPDIASLLDSLDGGDGLDD